MAETCLPKDLVAESVCFECLSSKEQLTVQTYLLAVIAGGSTNPKTLLSSANYLMELSEKELLAVQAYLLCQIVNK